MDSHGVGKNNKFCEIGVKMWTTHVQFFEIEMGLEIYKKSLKAWRLATDEVRQSEYSNQFKTGCWFQPIWKILVKLDHFPK